MNSIEYLHHIYALQPVFAFNTKLLSFDELDYKTW